MSLEQAALKMHNPLQATPQNLARGKEQFDTYCAPCHGESGDGNGPVAHLLKKPLKSLLVGPIKDRPDGYIYGVIRDGVRSSPSYAEEVPAEQRWQIVIYLRLDAERRGRKGRGRRQLTPGASRRLLLQLRSERVLSVGDSKRFN